MNITVYLIIGFILTVGIIFYLGRMSYAGLVAPPDRWSRQWFAEGLSVFIEVRTLLLSIPLFLLTSVAAALFHLLGFLLYKTGDHLVNPEKYVVEHVCPMPDDIRVRRQGSFDVICINKSIYEANAQKAQEVQGGKAK